MGSIFNWFIKFLNFLFTSFFLFISQTFFIGDNFLLLLTFVFNIILQFLLFIIGFRWKEQARSLEKKEIKNKQTDVSMRTPVVAAAVVVVALMVFFLS